MDVILLERVEKLGAIGDVVKVKNGFARNYLLPLGKALLATDANKARFERERVAIEDRNAKARAEAESEARSIEGATYVLIRQAGETGQLYGSVAARDISQAAKEAGHHVERKHVVLGQPIKTVGVHEVTIRLHPEVAMKITINVARSPDEAERQAKGENIIASLQLRRKSPTLQRRRPRIAARSKADRNRNEMQKGSRAAPLFVFPGQWWRRTGGLCKKARKTGRLPVSMHSDKEPLSILESSRDSHA
jgi:large subunit ribosomal protein L9